MSKACYYETLSVSRTASDGEIKTSYPQACDAMASRSQSGRQELRDQIQEISEAYDVLKDGDKRAAYDRFGHAAFEQGNGAGGHGFGADFGSAFSDIFEGIFGMAGGRARSSSGRERGADLRYNMEITLEDAYYGKTAEIRIPTSVTCEACSGSGAKAGTRPKACGTCGGHGRVRHAQGFFTLERTCPACHGRGQVIEDPCPSCSGSGRVTRERMLSVNIPQGVEDGTRIRLAGEGEAGMRGGTAGDLYIFLSLASHPIFQRDGADLHCRVPVSMVTAALGGEFEVPAIDGVAQQSEGAGRNSIRPAFPSSGQRYACPALQAER